jgi:hypothetical protein
MAQRKLELTITEALYQELQRIAQATGAGDLTGVAAAGLAQWISWRTAELDSRDPAQRYFVNEALDALLEGKK